MSFDLDLIDRLTDVKERARERGRESTLRSLALWHHVTLCLTPPTTTAIRLCICCGSEIKAEPRDAICFGISKLLENNNQSRMNYQLSGSALWNL